MRMRDIAAQLEMLEVEMLEYFLVHYILCTLPQQYILFRFLIIHIKTNGQLMSC